jgi:hypothetical protein
MFLHLRGNLKVVQSPERNSPIYTCAYDSQFMGCQDKTALLKSLMLMQILCIELHETIYCQTVCITVNFCLDSMV